VGAIHYGTLMCVLECLTILIIVVKKLRACLYPCKLGLAIPIAIHSEKRKIDGLQNPFASRAPHICRVGQNPICTPYMIVCMVISLLKISYIHRIYVYMYGSGQPHIFVRTCILGWLCANMRFLFIPAHIHIFLHTCKYPHICSHLHISTYLFVPASWVGCAPT